MEKHRYACQRSENQHDVPWSKVGWGSDPHADFLTWGYPRIIFHYKLSIWVVLPFMETYSPNIAVWSYPQLRLIRPTWGIPHMMVVHRQHSYLQKFFAYQMFIVLQIRVSICMSCYFDVKGILNWILIGSIIHQSHVTWLAHVKIAITPPGRKWHIDLRWEYHGTATGNFHGQEVFGDTSNSHSNCE